MGSCFPEQQKKQEWKLDMGFYQHLRETWNNLDPAVLRARMVAWRKEDVVIRIEHPTRLDRARSLGYRAKKGILVVRVRVKRGGRMREKMKSGRRSKTQRRMKVVSKSYQSIAEERVNSKFMNCEVLNSYFLAQDGKHYWFEVILVDPASPDIVSDPKLSWIAQPQHRSRVFRGLTAAGRRSRGLLTRKGKGAEKLRPSLRAHDRMAH